MYDDDKTPELPLRQILGSSACLPAGWPDKAAMNVGKLRETLAKGQSPQGCVTWAMEHQVPELRNLAQVHGIKKAFAIVCLARPGQNEAPHSGGVKRLLLTKRDGPVLDIFEPFL